MLKIISSILILSFVFFSGTQGFDTPNKKAPFLVKMDFALSLQKSMATSTVADAAEWSKGLWEFIAGTDTNPDDSVYGWSRNMLINFSDTMATLGYPQCSDIPTSGSATYPAVPGVTITFATGDKTVPTGSIWENPGTNYSKKVVADLSGVPFFEVQYGCDTDKPNIYLKYNFNALEAVDRKVEIQAQHDASTDKVSIILRMECNDASQCEGDSEKTAFTMHTADGNEYRIFGTRTVADSSGDEAKRMSVHGSKSLKLADVHIHDGTDLTHSVNMTAGNAGIDEHCVDFNSATYVPANGAADCTTAGFSAIGDLPELSTSTFSPMTDYNVNTVNGMSIPF